MAFHTSVHLLSIINHTHMCRTSKKAYTEASRFGNKRLISSLPRMYPPTIVEVTGPSCIREADSRAAATRSLGDGRRDSRAEQKCRVDWKDHGKHTSGCRTSSITPPTILLLRIFQLSDSVQHNIKNFQRSAILSHNALEKPLEYRYTSGFSTNLCLWITLQHSARNTASPRRRKGRQIPPLSIGSETMVQAIRSRSPKSWLETR
jgi:hypothetical protein